MNAITALMNEYVNWGGPIVTRAQAYRDGRLRGFTARELDYAVFARKAVDAPDDPEWHVAFMDRIREAGK